MAFVRVGFWQVLLSRFFFQEVCSACGSYNWSFMRELEVLERKDSLPFYLAS